MSDDQETPAGWYKNPQGAAPWRYWDGQRWTDHVHGEVETVPTPPAFVEAPPAPPVHEAVEPVPVPEVVGAAAYAQTAAATQSAPELTEYPQASEPGDLTEPEDLDDSIEDEAPVEEPEPAPLDTDDQPAESEPEKVEPVRRVADRPTRSQYQQAYAELHANQRAKNAQWVGVVLAGLIGAGAYLPLWSLNGTDTMLSDEQTTRFMFVFAALIGVVGAALAMLRHPQGPTMSIGAAIPVACVAAFSIQEFFTLDDGVPDRIETPSAGVGLIVLGVLVIAVFLLTMLALIHASSGRAAAGPPVFHAVSVLAGLGLATLVVVPEDGVTIWDHVSSGGDAAIGTITIVLALVGPFAAMVFLWQGTRSGAGLAFGTFASLAVAFVMWAQVDAGVGELARVDVTQPWPAAICALVGLVVAGVSAFGPGSGGNPDEIIEAYDAW